MSVTFGNGWDDVLGGEFGKDYYKQLRQFLKHEYTCGKYRIYPDMNDIFNAFRYTDYNDVKAVILGQDPYHGAGQAHGLCFSVQDGVEPPPSLVNIFKELQADLGFLPPKSGNLTKWAKNGVLLLNSVLTVREGQAGSHAGKGWETFTDSAIQALNERKEPICFLLWGAYAKAKASLITNPRHHILPAAHPSPLSAYNGFYGSRPFSLCNKLLGTDIDWNLNT